MDISCSIACTPLGNAGSFTLAFVVFWACLTTSVGTAAGAAHGYVGIFGDKVPYKYWVIALCVSVSFSISCLGC